MVLLTLMALAWAEQPLPSFSEDRTIQTWLRLNAAIEQACMMDPRTGGHACDPEPLGRTINQARAWTTHVHKDARILYLIGLAHRLRQEPKLAVNAYQQALSIDPSRQDAWSDLGELRLAEADYEGAREAFEHVSELVDSGPHSWIGPYRLAEVAGFEQQPEAFERHIKQALRRGFSFQQVADLPAWRQFYADPVMRDTVAKLVTVYGTPDLLKILEDSPL